MKKYILIVAGGKGLRMGNELPKQFLPIGGRPILIRTIETFWSYDSTIDIILVLPTEQQEYWKRLCETYNCFVPYRIADGGETRFHSVKNGLALIEEEGLVGVHDGVRPFVSLDVIARCYETAAEEQSAVPVINVVETLRYSVEKDSWTVPRHKYKLVQTPQVFSMEILKRAYCQKYVSSFTDDASVVEALGIPIRLVKGNRENIKITTPFDLKIANALV